MLYVPFLQLTVGILKKNKKFELFKHIKSQTLKKPQMESIPSALPSYLSRLATPTTHTTQATSQLKTQ